MTEASPGRGQAGTRRSTIFSTIFSTGTVTSRIRTSFSIRSTTFSTVYGTWEEGKALDAGSLKITRIRIANPKHHNGFGFASALV